MQNSYYQIYIKCPFYSADDGKQRISCEGIVEDSSISQYFRTKKGYKNQVQEYCCKDYERCSIHRAIMEKYGGAQ